MIHNKSEAVKGKPESGISENGISLRLKKQFVEKFLLSGSPIRGWERTKWQKKRASASAREREKGWHFSS
jgi:hypothetical protein